MFPLKDFIWKEVSFELNSLIKPPDSLDETLLTDEYSLNLEDNTWFCSLTLNFAVASYQ